MPNQDQVGPILHGRTPILRTFLDLIPCGAAIWGKDCWTPRVLNSRALQLIGYSGQDFRGDAFFWINRVHPQDRCSFFTVRERLWGGAHMDSCDYRFFPNGDQREIWLREFSVSYRDADTGKIEGIISTYLNISDLKLLGVNSFSCKQQSKNNCATVIDDLVHDILNCLQVIRWGIELLPTDEGSKHQLRSILNSVDGVQNLLREAKECLDVSGRQAEGEQ